MEDLPPIDAGADAPAARLIDDFIDDDDRDAPPLPSPAQLESERDEALRAEHAWRVWDAKKEQWTTQRVLISPDRWTWWKVMRTHNAQPSMGAGDFDLDMLAPSAWSMLFLGLHTPAEILVLVTDPQNYWLAVNEWAAVHCPPEKWADAIALMNAVRDNIATLLTVPRPTKHVPRAGE